MSTQPSEEEIYRQARERVKEKKAFFIHLAAYSSVQSFLVAIWAITGGGFPWFVFPLGGWGIGIFFHFLGVFVFSRTG